MNFNKYEISSFINKDNVFKEIEYNSDVKEQQFLDNPMEMKMNSKPNQIVFT
jgi:hypothetical protein